jgi:hypothetical protein
MSHDTRTHTLEAARQHAQIHGDPVPQERQTVRDAAGDGVLDIALTMDDAQWSAAVERFKAKTRRLQQEQAEQAAAWREANLGSNRGPR